MTADDVCLCAYLCVVAGVQSCVRNTAASRTGEMLEGNLLSCGEHLAGDPMEVLYAHLTELKVHHGEVHATGR